MFAAASFNSINCLGLNKYGEKIAALLIPPREFEIGPGKPNAAARKALEGLDASALGPRIVDQQMAQCCLAGLWLYHDFLDESHTISQEIETTTGSYWHGIMHRREPDYGNAKFACRRRKGSCGSEFTESCNPHFLGRLLVR